MTWLRRVFRLPAQESTVGIVLVFCVVSMSFMSIALVWQAQIIANQREAIQWLERLKFGGESRPVRKLTRTFGGLATREKKFCEHRLPAPDEFTHNLASKSGDFFFN